MRLIDADVLIEEIKNMSQRYCDCKDCDGRGQIIRVSEVIDIVKNEVTTAYSVENVVEELEELKMIYFLTIANTGDEKSDFAYENVGNALDKAIEIVKHGGVSDDVCEWKSASDGEFIKNPHTKRLYSNEPSMKNIYCNCCGKKIKVVE